MNPGDADLPLRRRSRRSSPPSACRPLWIATAAARAGRGSGYTVVDPTSVIVTHLTEVVRRNAAELLGRQDVRAAARPLKERCPAPVEELVPDLLTGRRGAARAADACSAEGVPIRDLGDDPGDLGDKARLTKDPRCSPSTAARRSRARSAPTLTGPHGQLSVDHARPDRGAGGGGRHRADAGRLLSRARPGPGAAALRGRARAGRGRRGVGRAARAALLGAACAATSRRSRRTPCRASPS